MPKEKNSASFAISSATSAARGTSIIVPKTIGSVTFAFASVSSRDRASGGRAGS